MVFLVFLLKTLNGDAILLRSIHNLCFGTKKRKFSVENFQFAKLKNIAGASFRNGKPNNN